MDACKHPAENMVLLHDKRPILDRIELRMTAAQVLFARTAQFSTARNAFGQKPEALEDSAVAEGYRHNLRMVLTW